MRIPLVRLREVTENRTRESSVVMNWDKKTKIGRVRRREREKERFLLDVPKAPKSLVQDTKKEREI
jgi:hypothetical protein